MGLEDFRGEAKPLDYYDVPRLAHRIGVGEDHLQAFLNVESRSTGFDRLGRPVILFEPHVFYRNLPVAQRKLAVSKGLAYPKWGQKPYPKDSYPRLHKAMEINEDAALMSCSWGSSQVLGENYRLVGYESIVDMVEDFMADEEEHVEAMVNYILATGIDDDIREERWDVAARVYNGPGYKKNGYHTKMAAEFAKLRKIPDVDWTPGDKEQTIMQLAGEDLKTVQRRLAELGYKEVGWADGAWGSKTRSAVMAFQADNDMPIIPGITQDLMSALMLAPARQVSEERQTTTAQDLRKAGSRTISAADRTGAVGGVAALGGAAAAITAALEGVQAQVDSISGLTDTVTGLFGSVDGMTPWLLIAFGAYTIYQQHVVKKARVDDHRSDKNPFPGGS